MTTYFATWFNFILSLYVTDTKVKVIRESARP